MKCCAKGCTNTDVRLYTFHWTDLEIYLCQLHWEELERKVPF